jgi:hypothetical protein
MTKLIVSFHNLRTRLTVHLHYTGKFRTAVFWGLALTFRTNIPCNRRTSPKYIFSNSLQLPSALNSRNIFNSFGRTCFSCPSKETYCTVPKQVFKLGGCEYSYKREVVWVSSAVTQPQGRIMQRKHCTALHVP